ncbi:MAG TPA: N-methyl-L-tryptophan oxidase [Stellaceae bacterium]|nr:N-methyl-L-tryptophan oxidase [Stellaceae bacterium]
MPIFDVAVIGLGAMGSAALYHIAKRGVRVVGFERARPAHEGGSSHGESRAIRLAYFEHESYVHLLRRAYENWRALERETGTSLLTITGILEAGVPGSLPVEGSRASAALHHLAQDELTGAEASARFPAFSLPPDWVAVFQPDGGILQAELACVTHVRAAEANGAEVRTTGIRDIRASSSSVRLQIEDGTTIDVGAVIVAAGPWMGELVPLLRPHLHLTRQVLVWFAPRVPALVRPPRMPIFLLDTREDTVYGFPDFAGTGVKAASHLPGRPLARAADARQDASAADAAPVARVLERFIPAAAGPVRAMNTCIYTRIRSPRADGSVDDDFVIDRHPDHPQIVLASPCSGHGFKFASVVGEILADLATAGTTRFDLGRFRAARFAPQAGSMTSSPD